MLLRTGRLWLVGSKDLPGLRVRVRNFFSLCRNRTWSLCKFAQRKLSLSLSLAACSLLKAKCHPTCQDSNTREPFTVELYLSFCLFSFFNILSFTNFSLSVCVIALMNIPSSAPTLSLYLQARRWSSMRRDTLTWSAIMSDVTDKRCASLIP